MLCQDLLEAVEKQDPDVFSEKLFQFGKHPGYAAVLISWLILHHRSNVEIGQMEDDIAAENKELD